MEQHKMKELTNAFVENGLSHLRSYSFAAASGRVSGTL